MPVERFQPDDQLPPVVVNCWWNDSRVNSTFQDIDSFSLTSTPGPNRVPEKSARRKTWSSDNPLQFPPQSKEPHDRFAPQSWRRRYWQSWRRCCQSYLCHPARNKRSIFDAQFFVIIQTLSRCKSGMPGALADGAAANKVRKLAVAQGHFTRESLPGPMPAGPQRSNTNCKQQLFSP